MYFLLQLCVVLKERKLNRLSGYDYSKSGWYFVTIDCLNLYPCFGEIKVGTEQCSVRTMVRTMELNELGLVAEKYWRKIPDIYEGIVLDEYVIMPNHVHGIIRIGGTAQCAVRTRNGMNNRFGLISKIIKSYKNVVTKEIRNNLGLKNFKWQRSFYDEIIRNEIALNRIRKYIIENPKNFVKAK